MSHGGSTSLFLSLFNPKNELLALANSGELRRQESTAAEHSTSAFDQG